MDLRRLYVLALLAAPSLVWAQTRPLIEHIEPTAGPPGTHVRIVGRGFQRSYHVLFNEHPIPTEELLPERITVSVPDNGQSGHFVLSNGSDEVESELFRVTAPEPAPVVSSIDPPASSPGGEVTLHGDHFAARPSDNTVRIGVLPMVVRSGDTTTLHVIVPDGAVSSRVFVRTTGAEGDSANELTIGARLIVREFVPAAAPPGSRVILRGVGFSSTASANRVSLHGRPLRVVRATPTELEVELPLTATTGTLALDVPGSGHYETANSLFVGPAPVIRSVDPSSGSAGTRVTLHGDHFGSDPSTVTVTLGGTPMTVNSVAPGEIVATVPQGAPTGPLAVTAAGVGPVSTASDFTVLAPVVVSSVNPHSGNVGDQITLTGTGFAPQIAQNTVLLGTVPATVLSASPTQLIVQVPDGHSAPFYVNVQGNGGTHTHEAFMVTQRPRIISIEPERGIPGTAVTLHGANLPADRALATVRLNGVDVPIRTYSHDAIVVTVPEHAQTGRFEVIGRLQGTGRAPMEFFVLSPVTLREVVPMGGPVGSSVTLHGEGFEPDATRLSVRMGTQVIHPTATSTTEITFAVPRGSRGGVISIEADGRQPVNSTGPFEVTVAPVLQGFSPAHGPAGTHVTFRGRNFGLAVANVGVTLGPMACPVAAVTPTTVECVTPEGAETGRFTLRVANSGEVRATTDFRVDAAHTP